MGNGQPIIVGAGPVGLAAAVFLAREGVFPRIIDGASQIGPHSRALAVNPRTLEILEPSGVTADMLAIGKRIHRAIFSHGSTVLGQMTFESLQHKYPIMLALSQATTERLLEAKLNELGGHVEWNCRLTGCRNASGGVEVDLQTSSDQTQSVMCPWLLAADGAHSAARESLGIKFVGDTFEKPWYLADVPLMTALDEEAAHVFFLDEGGFLFLLRVIGEKSEARSTAPLWRVIGNVPDILGRLIDAEVAGRAVWTSTFHIAHRINERMQEGGVYFAGDSAHVHSPIGARGMNLGIEDAWVFSQLVVAGRMSEYHAMRHGLDRSVVRRIELLSRMARGESAAARALRMTALPAMARIPLTRNRLIEMLTGLDHPLPVIAGTEARL